MYVFVKMDGSIYVHIHTYIHHITSRDVMTAEHSRPLDPQANTNLPLPNQIPSSADIFCDHRFRFLPVPAIAAALISE